MTKRMPQFPNAAGNICTKIEKRYMSVCIFLAQDYILLRLSVIDEDGLCLANLTSYAKDTSLPEEKRRIAQDLLASIRAEFTSFASFRIACRALKSALVNDTHACRS